jgi:hypothetical protein
MALAFSEFRIVAMDFGRDGLGSPVSQKTAVISLPMVPQMSTFVVEPSCGSFNNASTNVSIPWLVSDRAA